jgi:hypothetical protein
VFEFVSAFCCVVLLCFVLLCCVVLSRLCDFRVSRFSWPTIFLSCLLMVLSWLRLHFGLLCP